MKKLTPLAYCALMIPAATYLLGAGTAQAQSTAAASAMANEIKVKTTDVQKSSAPVGALSTSPGTQPTMAVKTMATESKVTTTVVQKSSAPVAATSTHLSSKPGDSFSADDLIGKNVMHRGDDKKVGEINDLVIDKHGQILAVIVEVGGFLGMGEKNVALNWDTIDRTANKSGKGYELRVDASEKTLTDAPIYKTN